MRNVLGKVRMVERLLHERLALRQLHLLPRRRAPHEKPLHGNAAARNAVLTRERFTLRPRAQNPHNRKATVQHLTRLTTTGRHDQPILTLQWRELVQRTFLTGMAAEMQPISQKLPYRQSVPPPDRDRQRRRAAAARAEACSGSASAPR